MKKFWVCFLALLVASFISLPMVVFADTVTFSGVSANDGSYYIAPYTLTISGVGKVDAFCIDFYHHSYLGQTWTASATPVSGPDWTNTYQASNTPSGTYAAMAYLASIYGTYSSNLNTQIDIQHAIWDLSSGQQANSTSGMPYLDSNALYWFNEGWSNTTNTSGWIILTDISGSKYPPGGYNGITLAGAQEFLYKGPVATPEPGTIMLFGSGILGVYGFSRKKRTQLKT